MPVKNVRKIYLENAYYHAYNRGVNKEPIFLDDEDYRTFLNLIKRLLSPNPFIDKRGREYLNIYGKMELIAFCLMPNHFHILIRQASAEAMTEFFRSLATSYSRYFNNKYDRVGHVFQNNYRASLIDSDQYFQYISYYIHLNPKNYLTWKYSSMPFFLGTHQADWIHPDRIIQSCGGVENYRSNIRQLSIDETLNEAAQSILMFES